MANIADNGRCEFVRGRLSHSGLVLAAVPNAEPLVLDLGITSAAVRPQPGLVGRQWTCTAVLPAVLARLPLA